MQQIHFERTKFNPQFETFARHITNRDGQHNSAYDPELWSKMPPQDSLVKFWGWFHGVTGFSSMFLWKSGRQDAYVILDTPNPSEEQINTRKAELEMYKPYIKPITVEIDDVARICREVL